MIMNISNTRDDRCMLNWGTHNGMFHCDEVVAIAILKVTYAERLINVVRTRELQELEQLDLVVDIGGGMFDHHMAGFNVRRSTGEKYASAGLVWKTFAEKAIKSVMDDIQIFIDDDEIEKVKQRIDKEVMIPVDMEDNGESEANSSHIFSFISKFLPSWMEKPNYLAYDAAFRQVVMIVCDILWEIIRDTIVQIVTEQELQKKYDSIRDGILEIPV